MDWFQWVLIIASVGGIGAILYFRFKGVLTTDKAVIGIDTVVQFVRKAEEMWASYTAAGPRKKAWVLAQLQDLASNVDSATLSNMIDTIVSYLNEIDWAR